MKKTDKIYIAGHTGLVGSALLRRLQQEGFTDIVVRTHAELELTDEQAVERFLSAERPDYVFIAAGKVGGITANSTYPADFFYQNAKMLFNLIHHAYKSGVKKLLSIGCSCLYPRECPQPIKEEYLLTGPFEPTNDAYSAAKLAALKMCQAYNRQYKANFVTCIADNLFGPGDRLSLQNSHVVSALIAKFADAVKNRKDEVPIWGTGNPVRGFLYVDDLVDACLFLMERYDSPEPVNVGSGAGVSIRELAEAIKGVSGFKGRIVYDTSKPDGMPKKMLDGSKLAALGWKPKTDLRAGLAKTYDWYTRNHEK